MNISISPLYVEFSCKWLLTWGHFHFRHYVIAWHLIILDGANQVGNRSPKSPSQGWESLGNPRGERKRGSVIIHYRDPRPFSCIKPISHLYITVHYHQFCVNDFLLQDLVWRLYSGLLITGLLCCLTFWWQDQNCNLSKCCVLNMHKRRHFEDCLCNESQLGSSAVLDPINFHCKVLITSSFDRYEHTVEIYYAWTFTYVKELSCVSSLTFLVVLPSLSFLQFHWTMKRNHEQFSPHQLLWNKTLQILVWSKDSTVPLTHNEVLSQSGASTPHTILLWALVLLWLIKTATVIWAWICTTEGKGFICFQHSASEPD